MKKLISIIAALGLIIAAAGTASAATNKAVQDARNGVARIVCLYIDEYGDLNGSTGTGFAIGRQGTSATYFITNNHVINSNPDGVFVVMDKLFDEFGDIIAIEAEVVKTWTSPDIAILRTKTPIEGRTPLPMSTSKDLEVTQPVYALGFPGVADTLNDKGSNLPSEIDDITVTTGSVTKSKSVFNDSDCVQIDAVINHGNSGGPLLDEYGNVVGINTYGLDGNNLAVYIDYVTRYFDDNNLPYYSAFAETAQTIQDAPPAYVESSVERPRDDTTSYVGVAVALAVVLLAAVVGVVVLMSRRRVPVGTSMPPHRQPVSTGAAPGGYTAPMGAAPAYGAGAGGASKITGLSGHFAGNSFPLAGVTVMGRDPRRCNIVFPDKTAGVSSLHCEITRRGSARELVDRGSTYGTFLGGVKLEVNRPYALRPGDRFYLGQQENTFRVE